MTDSKPDKRTYYYGFTRDWSEHGSKRRPWPTRYWFMLRLRGFYWSANHKVTAARGRLARLLTPIRRLGVLMLMIAAVSVVLESLTRTGRFSTMSGVILDYSPGVTLEALSIAVTIFVIDTLVVRTQRDELKRQLIRDMGGQSSDFALRAVRELKEHGWLKDGTLVAQYFDDANLQGAHLLGADCREAHFRNARLSGVSLSGANLRHTDFYMADLEAAELFRTDLVKSKLDGVNLVGANLDEADLRHAGLCEANLADAKAKWAWFDNASLRSALLTSINAPGADFTGADLTGADLHGAQLDHAIFRDASLTGANLTGASLVRADFKGAQIIGAHFTTADVSDADFTGARIEDCGFWEIIYSDSTKWPAGVEPP